MPVLVVAALVAGGLGVFGGIAIGEGINDLKHLAIILSLMYLYFKFYQKGHA